MPAYVPKTKKCPNGMCPIPAGKFKMGSTNGYKNERPVRETELSEYHMMRHPVTVGQYKAYLRIEKKEGDRFRAMIKGCGGSAQWQTVEKKKGQGKVRTREDAAKLLPRFDGKKVCEAKIEPIVPPSMPELPDGFDGDDQPMLKVNWEYARAYCQFYGMDLPTEAQWERGARGLAGDKEFGTRSGKPSKKEAHYGARTTAPVCSKPANDLGLCDMAGQVWEWTLDWYWDDTYKSMAAKDPKGPKEGRYKALRGGSWKNGRFFSRAACRIPKLPNIRSLDAGFRCVAAPQDSIKFPEGSTGEL